MARTPPRLFALCFGRLPSGNRLLEQFVGHHPGKNNRPDDCVFDMGWNPIHQHNHVAQDLHECGANHNPDYGTRSSSEATPAQNGGGNGVKLIKIPEINRLGGIDVEDEKQTAQA